MVVAGRLSNLPFIHMPSAIMTVYGPPHLPSPQLPTLLALTHLPMCLPPVCLSSLPSVPCHLALPQTSSFIDGLP